MSLKSEAILFFAFLALVVASQPCYAGANETTSDGHPIFWSTKGPVHYTVNPAGVQGLAGDLQKLLVIGAIEDAFSAWTSKPGASIQAIDDGATPQTGTTTTTAGVDGVNVISFQDPGNSIPFPPGVLAVTITSYAPAAGNYPIGNQVISATQGQLLDADIVFNPGVVFSPLGTSGSNDLVAIATHEIGHFFGLDHSGVLSSIMDPYSESGGSGSSSREVESDDVATFASLYPAPGFTSAQGTISGTITTSTGSPVKSADVIAVSKDGGIPVASQLSGADGSFTISGLAAGSYTVLAEPLDGPISLSNFPGYYFDGQALFGTTMLGGAASPTTISVSTGQTASANVVVPAPPANFLNITSIGAILQTQTVQGLTFSKAPLYLPRGKPYQLFVAGSSFGNDSNVTLSSPSPGILLLGATTTPSSFTLPGKTVRQQNVSLSANAPLGPSNLLLSNTIPSTSAMPGGIVVTVNPVIGGVADAASGATTLSPGSIFSIYGSDLAAATEAAHGNPNTPVPTNLGGVSVKVGDRYAPLFIVLPGQINAMVPFEVTGSSVPVTVETGPNAAGNTFNLKLAASSPGLFSVDSSGKGQGAIVGNSDFMTVAPASSGIPGAHPAKPGDIIVIFASGLGPLTSVSLPGGSPAPLPSGVAAGANGSTIPTLARPLQQVLIGGQPVPAQDILFAGMAPNFVGLYQVDVQLPANVQLGNAVNVQLTTAEGQVSNTVTIAVSQ